MQIKIFQDELKYEPGDHIGVFPENSSEIVNGLLERLEGAESPDSPVELQVIYIENFCACYCLYNLNLMFLY